MGFERPSAVLAAASHHFPMSLCMRGPRGPRGPTGPTGVYNTSNVKQMSCGATSVSLCVELGWTDGRGRCREVDSNVTLERRNSIRDGRDGRTCEKYIVKLRETNLCLISCDVIIPMDEMPFSIESVLSMVMIGDECVRVPRNA